LVYSRLRSFFPAPRHPLCLPSFPTRRSSDLLNHRIGQIKAALHAHEQLPVVGMRPRYLMAAEDPGDVVACPPPFRNDRLRKVLRSEEHTSELQSLAYLVCRLLLEKKKKKYVE